MGRSIGAIRAAHRRYGLGIRFLRQEYAASYRRIRLPPPLPADGDPDTEITVGAHDALPAYSSDPPGAPGAPILPLGALARKCVVCSVLFDEEQRVLQCHACGVMGHVTCLAEHFVRASGDSAELIPRYGCCPQEDCGERLRWSKLVRGVMNYRRHRGTGAAGVDSILQEGTRASSEASGFDDGQHSHRHRGEGAQDAPESSRRLWLVDDSSEDEPSDLESEDDGALSDSSNDVPSNAQAGQDSDDEERLIGWRHR